MTHSGTKLIEERYGQAAMVAPMLLRQWDIPESLCIWGVQDNRRVDIPQKKDGSVMNSSPHGVADMAGQGFRMMQRKRLFIFLGISAAYLVSYFHRSAPAVVGPEIASELGLAPASLGILGSTYFWAYAGAQLPAGLLADTWGARKTMSFFVLLAAVGGAVFALAPSLSLLSLGRFLVGLGVGFIYVPAIRIMTDWYRADELATYSGVLLAVGNIGALVSAAPLVFMMQSVGWRNAFLLVALFTVLAALFCWRVVRDKPSDMGLPGPGGEEATPSPAHPSEKTGLGQALAAVFSHPKFYLLGFLMFCFYGTLMSIGSLWAGGYLQHVCGLSQQTAGNIIMMFPLGMVFGCPLSGYLSDKVIASRKKILIGGAALHLTAYIPLIIIPDITESFLYVLFLWYGITGGFFVSNFACTKEIVEPRFAGTAVGAVNVFLFSGAAFFQAVLGVVIGSYPRLAGGIYPPEAYRTAFLVAAASLAAAAVLFFFFKEGREESTTRKM